MSRLYVQLLVRAYRSNAYSFPQTRDLSRCCVRSIRAYPRDLEIIERERTIIAADDRSRVLRSRVDPEARSGGNTREAKESENVRRSRRCTWERARQ